MCNICVDINECNGANRCVEICVNTIGSYECTCIGNGEIALANGSCVGNEPSRSTNYSVLYIPICRHQ